MGRVETQDGPMVLGPVDCGHIDPHESSWRFSSGKRLTITLAPTEARKAEGVMKRDWERKQAEAKAEAMKTAVETESAKEDVTPATYTHANPISHRALFAGGILVAIVAMLAALFLVTKVP